MISTEPVSSLAAPFPRHRHRGPVTPARREWLRQRQAQRRSGFAAAGACKECGRPREDHRFVHCASCRLGLLMRWELRQRRLAHWQ